MKVRKMIDLLKTMNQEAEVKLHGCMGEPALFVLTMENDTSTVWIDTQSDCDLKSELRDRFKFASEEQVDELGFYTDLVDTGITVKMIADTLGNEAADHMQDFCREHGLL